MSDTPSAPSDAHSVASVVEKQPLSPNAAAKRVGCNRTTVLRALQNKELPGWKDNEKGHWKIDEEALERWAKNRVRAPSDAHASHQVHTSPSKSEDFTSVERELREELRTMEGDKARAEERVRGLERELSKAEKRIGEEKVRADQAEQRSGEERVRAERAEKRLADAFTRSQRSWWQKLTGR